MTLRDFIRQYRAGIDTAIAIATGQRGGLCDDSRKRFVRGYAMTREAALREGVAENELRDSYLVAAKRRANLEKHAVCVWRKEGRHPTPTRWVLTRADAAAVPQARMVLVVLPDPVP